MQEHPLQDSMMSQGLHTIRHNSTYPRDADQLQSGARNGSKEAAADVQALLHAVADVQRRVDNFSWKRRAPLRKLNHVQPTLPPKGSLARSVAMRSLWALSQKSRVVLSVFQARQSTCLQLHSERSGFLRFRIPAAQACAMSGDEEGISALRFVSLCCFGTNFNCSCVPLSKVAHRNLAPPNFSQQLVILALDFLTMLNTLRVVMTMTTKLWNSGRGYDRHPRAKKWMLVLLMSTLCVRMSVGIGRCHHCLCPHRRVKSCFVAMLAERVHNDKHGFCALFLTMWTMLL